jgi:hypothetical protein
VNGPFGGAFLIPRPLAVVGYLEAVETIRAKARDMVEHYV